MLVRHRLTGFICALKSIRKDLITESNMLSQVLRELKISLFAYHPHLVTVYGYFHDEDNLYMLNLSLYAGGVGL
jgi:aurora kinase